jgi:DNA-binding winged helix-turn-helix (wHTH) protein
VQPPGQVRGVIRFGPFEVDLEEGVLRKHRTKVRLQTQPFQILAALLETPGRAVTRDELRRRLWPEDTFVDFEHGLNAAMARLRQALGDSAEQPRYIETLAKRDYRFNAKVAGPAIEIAEQSPSSPVRRSTKPRLGSPQPCCWERAALLRSFSFRIPRRQRHCTRYL